LWLLGRRPDIHDNLREEAARRGITSDRLIFAPSMKFEPHIARYQVADLFLDTMPYNAHTTASDALWMGCPVLTTFGGTFSGRVAASLLRAAGIPELAVADLAAYQKLAIELGRHPDRLHALRQRLVEGRATGPLFDLPRFTRALERAYEGMWAIYEDGEGPRPFSVTDDWHGATQAVTPA
ncbi:MAG: glycosyltransferase, partial [Alphaproteobacteria bacterium]|nr:glycosyltransferase [Alphaproteobacteria bacterium]